MDQVFEVGQMWKWIGGSGGKLLIVGVGTERVSFLYEDGRKDDLCICDMRMCVCLIAPAPKPGTLWKRDGDARHLRIIGMRECMGTQSLSQFIYPLNPNDPEQLGACARWLHDNGYKPVEKKDEPADDLQNATIVSSVSGRIGHIWRNGDAYTVTFVTPGGRVSHGNYHALAIRALIQCGDWTHIEVPAKSVGHTVRIPRPSLFPNLRASQPFFDLIAAVYTTPTREQSRRYVDMAVAAIKGEPFWRATQAVLVALADRVDLSPMQIQGAVDACRRFEARRSEVAAGRRALTGEQLVACIWAGYDGWLGYPVMGHFYERARAAC